MGRSNGNYYRRAWHRAWDIHQGHTGWFTESGALQFRVDPGGLVSVHALDGVPVFQHPLAELHPTDHEAIRAVEKWLDEGDGD